MTGTNEVVRRQDPLRSRPDFHRLFATSGHIPHAIVAAGHMREVVFNRVRRMRGQWLVKHPHFGSGVSREPVGSTLDLSRYPDAVYFEEFIAADRYPQLRVTIGKDRRPRSVDAFDYGRVDEERVLRRSMINGKLGHRLVMLGLHFARKLAAYETGEVWLDCLMVGSNEDAHLYVCGVSRTAPARMTRS